LEQLADVLAELVTKFGMTAEHVWPHVVYVTWINAVINLVTGVGTCLMGIVIARVAIRNFKEADGDGEDEAIVLLFICVPALFLLILGLALITTNIAGIIDPVGVTILKLLGK
jgi:hypothetical protein